jgi:Helix-hairpin-helix motif
MRRAALLFFVFAAPASLAAVYESPITAETEDDLLAAQERGELSPESAERLIDLLTAGVDLNSAGRDELYELPGLGYKEVDAIIEYRKLKGRIEDPAELVGAEAISGDALLQMAPFIRLEPANEVLPVSGKMRLMGAVGFADTVPPPAYFGGEFKGPWNLRAGIELVTTRFRPSTAFYDGTRDTLMVSWPYYALNMPKLYGQWKAGNRQIIVGTFKVGFAEQLTLDNTQKTHPNGFDVRTRTLQPESGITITYGPGGTVEGVNSSLSSPCRFSTGELSQTPCPSDGSIPKAMPDYRWREVFRGIAASIEELELGEKGPKLSLFGFGSLQTKSVYQYQLIDKRYCSAPPDGEPDPRWTDPACGSPAVYVRQTDPSDPSPRLAYSTIPGVLHELVFGGRAKLQPIPRFYFGITGYGAIPLWTVSQMELDFQEWARTPWNGPYGAIGIDGKITLGPVDLFTEVTRTFNRIPSREPLEQGGGGWGAILRGLVNPKGHLIEGSLRFYDRGFSNPYSSPVSSPDILFGQRARNEAGLKLDYKGKLPADFFVNAWVNLWVLPWADIRAIDALGNVVTQSAAAGTFNLHGRARVDYRGFSFIQGGVWFDYKNNDLARSQRGTCYTGALDLDNPLDSSSTEPQGGCFGESYRVSATVTVKPHKRYLNFTVHADQSWTDDTDHPTDFRIDRHFWLEARSWLLDNRLNFSARAAYRFFDAYGPERKNDVFWGTFEVAAKPWAFLQPALRYDIYLFNDQRPIGERRNPNPAMTLRLIVDAKF